MGRLISVLILPGLLAAFECPVPLQRPLFFHFTVWRSHSFGLPWPIVPLCKARPSVFVFFSFKHSGGVFLSFL